MEGGRFSSPCLPQKRWLGRKRQTSHHGWGTPAIRGKWLRRALAFPQAGEDRGKASSRHCFSVNSCRPQGHLGSAQLQLQAYLPPLPPSYRRKGRLKLRLPSPGRWRRQHGLGALGGFLLFSSMPFSDPRGTGNSPHHNLLPLFLGWRATHFPLFCHACRRPLMGDYTGGWGGGWLHFHTFSSTPCTLLPFSDIYLLHFPT